MSTDKYVFVFHKDYAEVVTKNFKAFLDDDLYIDIIFVCRNNKKVGAHQVVFGCLSKFFYSIFLDSQVTSKEKILYIYVPDIRAKIMKYILQFIYSGKAMLNKEELAEFNEDIKLLGMPLDHFSSDNDIGESNDTLKKSEKVISHSEVSPADTVDLTDTSVTDNPVTQVDSDNNTIDGIKNQEVVSPTKSVASNQVDESTSISITNNTSTSPNNKDSHSTDQSAQGSENKNVITSTTTNSSSSEETTDSHSTCQSPQSSETKNRSTSKRTNSVCSKKTTASVEGKNHEDLAEMKDDGNSRKRKRSDDHASPVSKSKISAPCIDLDGSDDDADVIIIS